MSAEVWEVTHVASTSAGMCGLWQPEHFTHVDSLDSWEDEVSEDLALAGHIAAGAFVPINVGGDGAFQVTLRDTGRDERETRYTLVSSQPYLLVSNGSLALGGLENVGSYVGGATPVPFRPGRFTVTIHLIDWKAEPGSMAVDGQPTDGALPDFLVEVIPEAAHPPLYRTKVETFERP
jgi:hypothetical protein